MGSLYPPPGGAEQLCGVKPYEPLPPYSKHHQGFGRLTAEDKKEIDWALSVTGTSEFRHRTINDCKC